MLITHYDIMMMNAVILLSSGWGYLFIGDQPVGFLLLSLSLCNVVGIVLGRVRDLEKQQREQYMEQPIEQEHTYETEPLEQEDEEDEEDDDDEYEEDEEEDGPQNITTETRPDNEEITDLIEEHYCGSEACGAEITNLSGAGLCAACGRVYYCNRDCQTADWNAGHKLVCGKTPEPSFHQSVPTESAPTQSIQVPELPAEPVPELPAEPPAEVPAVAVTQPLPELPTTVSDDLPPAPSMALPPPPPMPPRGLLPRGLPPPPPLPPTSSEVVG